jgi:hypothetical protein
MILIFLIFFIPILFILIYVIKLHVDILNNNDNTTNNTYLMKTNLKNEMTNTGKIIMDKNYNPEYDNDIITLRYLDTVINNIQIDISNFLLKNIPNTMDKNGSIIMNNDHVHILPNELITKKYVDSNLPSNATSNNLGLIKLSGDLTGTADTPIIKDNVVTLNKIANLKFSNSLLGSDDSNKITEYSLGNNLFFNNNLLELTDIIKTVNGVYPEENGNVPISIGRVFTGILNNLIDVDNINLKEGDVYVVSDDPISDNDGRSFILSVNPNRWLEISKNLAATDARYLRLSGNNEMKLGSRITMFENYIPLTQNDITTVNNVEQIVNRSITGIEVTNFLKTDIKNEMTKYGKILTDKDHVFDDPSELINKQYVDDINTNILKNKIILKTNEINQMAIDGTILTDIDYIFTDPNELINKKYVDLNLPTNASTNNLGLIKLSGDLTGTADTPIIKDNVVTLNKIANSNSPNVLLGFDNSNKITEYSLGSNLFFNNNLLELTNVARTVNGMPPDNNGNVSVSIGRVFTGILDKLINTDSDILNEGDVYIVSDDPDSDNNGRAFIFNIKPNRWIEISKNLAVTDARYLRLSGNNEMKLGSRITMFENYSPLTQNDITTVDNVEQIVNRSITRIDATKFLKTDIKNEMGANSKIIMDKNHIFDDVNELVNKKYVDNENIKFSKSKYLAMISPHSLGISNTINAIGTKIYFGPSLQAFSYSDNIKVSYALSSYEVTSTKKTVIKISYSPPPIVNDTNRSMVFRTYNDSTNSHTYGPKGLILTSLQPSSVTSVVELLNINNYLKFSIRVVSFSGGSFQLGSEGYLIIEEL